MLIKPVKIPNIGKYKNVDVIEIHVHPEDDIKKDDSLITVETDKASMDIPSPYAGKVIDIKLTVGDQVSEGDLILNIMIKQDYDDQTLLYNNKKFHASPAVRRLVRIFSLDLSKIIPSGKNGRITQEDCEKKIKEYIQIIQNTPLYKNEHEASLNKKTIIQPLSKINKLSGKNILFNWINIPHVTLYDHADITYLEKFRENKQKEAKRLNIKLTPLSFLIKTLSIVLREFPIFNSSLSKDNSNIIIKKYINIGFAVDSPKGLVVPVIKNINEKGIFEIASEIMILIKKAHNNKLQSNDIEDGTFTISSLGNLGTSGFTPIIHKEEAAILGISKKEIKPVWNGEKFIPKCILPLSLSTDHRIIDGAIAAKFLTRYSYLLQEFNNIILY